MPRLKWNITLAQKMEKDDIGGIKTFKRHSAKLTCLKILQFLVIDCVMERVPFSSHFPEWHLRKQRKIYKNYFIKIRKWTKIIQFDANGVETWRPRQGKRTVDRTNMKTNQAWTSPNEIIISFSQTYGISSFGQLSFLGFIPNRRAEHKFLSIQLHQRIHFCVQFCDETLTERNIIKYKPWLWAVREKCTKTNSIVENILNFPN